MIHTTGLAVAKAAHLAVVVTREWNQLDEDSKRRFRSRLADITTAIKELKSQPVSVQRAVKSAVRIASDADQLMQELRSVRRGVAQTGVGPAPDGGANTFDVSENDGWEPVDNGHNFYEEHYIDGWAEPTRANNEVNRVAGRI